MSDYPATCDVKSCTSPAWAEIVLISPREDVWTWQCYSCGEALLRYRRDLPRGYGAVVTRLSPAQCPTANTLDRSRVLS